jgi:hypothetical protein
MAYQDWTWPQRRSVYELQLQAAMQSLQGATPQQAVDALGLGKPEATRQAYNNQHLAMRWPTPFPHYYLELTFLKGGLEYADVYEREPYPVTGGPGTEHTAIGQILELGRRASLMVVPFVWLLLFAIAMFHRNKRKVWGHMMLASSIPWSLAGLADHALRWRRLNLLDPEDLGGYVLWFIPSIVSAAVLIWGYRTRPIQPFRACSHCEYNLTGNVSGICPECGTPVPEGLRETLTVATRQSEA